MKKILTIILFLLVGLNLQAQEKISPELFDLLKDKEKVDVFIVLKDKADLSAAKEKKGKFAKGAYVFNTLVETAQNSQGFLKEYLSSQNIKYKSYYIVNAILAELDRDNIKAIAAFPEVEFLFPDVPIELIAPEVTPDVVFSRSSVEWGIAKIRADEVWSEYGKRGEGVVVAGQDTGFDWTHPALKDKYRGWDEVTETADHDYNWFDAVTSLPENADSEIFHCGFKSEQPCDDHNHGTHTMGTMVGEDGENNQIGVAPGAKWIGARNMHREGGPYSWAMDCFQWFLAPKK